jgi:hypothetical protein
MAEGQLSALRKLPEYRQVRAHIFQSDGAMEWFVRKHRQPLIECGALLLIAGQWHAHEGLFDAYVLRSGAESAKCRVAA